MFDDGAYSHVNKDIRQVLGQPVVGPWSRTYCGGGDQVVFNKIGITAVPAMEWVNRPTFQQVVRIGSPSG